MKTDNELIAEFMGFKPYEDRRYGTMWPDPSRKDNPVLIGQHYHESWDWIIPVIHKIQSMGYRVNIDFGNIEQCAISNIDPMMSVVEDSAYKSVVSFIKWYNQQMRIAVNPPTYL